jgi:hypothetical protein
MRNSTATFSQNDFWGRMRFLRDVQDVSRYHRAGTGREVDPVEGIALLEEKRGK